MSFESAMKQVELEAVKKVLKNMKPTSGTELLKDCGFTLRMVSYGAFRDVYEIVGTPYVVKIPIHDSQPVYAGRDHSETEYAEWKRAMRLQSYKSIRHYLPVIHYFERSTGLLLIDKYTQLENDDTRFDFQIKQISKWLKNKGYGSPDVGTSKRENYGIDSKGRLRILDLGCFVMEDEVEQTTSSD